MTVKEVIDQLSKFPPNEELFHFEYDYDNDREEFWAIDRIEYNSKGRVKERLCVWLV